MKKIWLLMTVLSMFVVGCGPSVLVAEVVMTESPEVIAPPTLLALETAIVATNMPIEIPTLVPEMTLPPTMVSPTCVPPSLMLHSKDRYKLADEVIPWLKENGYTTITYSDFLLQLEGVQQPNPKQVILSIDDINTEYINPYFFAMMEDLHNNGMVASIGINPKATVEQNPGNYETLRLWASWGIELDNHTMDHAYLPTNGDELEYQIGEAAKRIYEGTGISPVALILPFGAVADKAGVIDELIFNSATDTGHRFVVGIPDGRLVTFDENLAMFVGRVGTDYPTFNLANWSCGQ